MALHEGKQPPAEVKRARVGVEEDVTGKRLRVNRPVDGQDDGVEAVLGQPFQQVEAGGQPCAPQERRELAGGIAAVQEDERRPPAQRLVLRRDQAVLAVPPFVDHRAALRRRIYKQVEGVPQ